MGSRSDFGGCGVFLVLFVSTRGVGRLVTDYLFFQEIGAGNAWKTQVGAKVGLAAVFGLGFFLIAYVNLLIANRVAPLVRVIATGDDLFDRYRTLVEPRQRPLQIGVSVALGLITGVGSSTQPNSLLLFLGNVAQATGHGYWSGPWVSPLSAALH